MQLDKNFLKILNEIQHIPSTPFIVKPIKKYLQNYLNNKQITYEINNYCLVVKQGKIGTKKLVFMAHTDHPGIILNKNHRGKIMGTLGINRIKHFIDQGNLHMRVYDPNGDILGKCKVVKLYGRNCNNIQFETNFDVPNNSCAQFDIEYFDETDDSIKAYNLDDGINVALMLWMISKNLKSDYEINFVFNFHEEVHQVSSWAIAKDNLLKIDKQDYIINLECLRVENVSEKYPIANYEDGVILQLSNIGCLFGYKDNNINLSEEIVKSATQSIGEKIQIGVIKDACDSRPFTQFRLTPNIVTLTIPNKNKHNWNYETNEIVPEEIFKKDIISMENIITAIIKSDSTQYFKSDSNLSMKLKKHDEVTDKALMLKKEILNERLHISYKHIAKKGYYYNETLPDLVLNSGLKAISYIKYFLLKMH